MDLPTCRRCGYPINWGAVTPPGGPYHSACYALIQSALRLARSQATIRRAARWRDATWLMLNHLRSNR